MPLFMPEADPVALLPATAGDKKEKLRVRVGNGTLEGLMTRSQAQRYGDQNIPADLKRAGFKTVIFRSDPEINGADFFRVNYGMTVKAGASCR